MYDQNKNLDSFTIMCKHTPTHADTNLFGSAGDETLVQPESLFLRETLSLVVPKQGTLDLSHTRMHTHIYRKQTRRERSGDDRCLQSSVQETGPFAW